MTVVAISLDGCLRLRNINTKKSVVEIRSHLFPGDWVYCIHRSLPSAAAMELFENQSQHHVDRTRFLTPIVNPGI